MEKDDQIPTPMDTESAEESETAMETVEGENKDAGETKQVTVHSPKRSSGGGKVTGVKPTKKGPSESSKETVETVDPAGQAKQALEAHPPKRPTGGKKTVTTKPSKKDEPQAPMDKENVSKDGKPAPETMPPPQVRGKKSILSPRNKQSPRTSTETSAASDEPKDNVATCSSETQQAAEVWPPKVRLGGKKISETVPSPSKGKKDEPHDSSSTSKEFMEIARTDTIVATVQVQPGVNVPASSGQGPPAGEQIPVVTVDPGTPDSPGTSTDAPPTDTARERQHTSGPAPDPEDDDDDDDEEVVEDRDKSTYL